MPPTIRNLTAIGVLALALAASGTVVGHPVRAQTTTVTIANFAFMPATLTVAAGTTVTWTNQDSAPHTVTSDTGLFDSGTLNQGQSYSRTFSSPGTFPYHCAIHLFMKAQIVVQPSGATATSPSPTPTSSGPATSPSATSTPTASPGPTATSSPAPPQTRLLVSAAGGGKLRVGHSATLRISVYSSQHHQPVRGATVTLNARTVGVRKVTKAKTNGKGSATFRHLRPTRAGKLTISVSKKGFIGKKIRLRVRA